VPGTNPALQTWNGQAFVVADGSAQNRISLPFLQVNSGAATYVVGADNNGVWSYYNPYYLPNITQVTSSSVAFVVLKSSTGQLQCIPASVGSANSGGVGYRQLIVPN
jgi:hypothetical protein